LAVRRVELHPMVSLLKRSASGTRNLDYLIRYVSIGAIVVSVDLATFQGLVAMHVFLPLTTTVAFVLATVVHFTLNKLWTFRVPGTPNRYQLSAYVTVLLASFVVTQAVVEVSVLNLHLVPIAAKLLAIFVQLPVSFLGHRYFTFRDGRETGA
jgi:putative flippase GtrA